MVSKPQITFKGKASRKLKRSVHEVREHFNLGDNAAIERKMRL